MLFILVLSSHLCHIVISKFTQNAIFQVFSHELSDTDEILRVQILDPPPLHHKLAQFTETMTLMLKLCDKISLNKLSLPSMCIPLNTEAHQKRGLKMDVHGYILLHIFCSC